MSSLVVEALTGHHVAHEVRDPHAGGTRPVDDDALIAQPLPLGPDGRQRGGPHDGGGALHVVVEGAQLIAVSVEDAVGVTGSEILPMHHGVGEHRLRCLHEVVHERVVTLTSDAGVPEPQVEVIVEEIEVVGPDVEDDRQHPVGIHPAGGGVERLLADADQDAAHTLIADPEDALGVGDDQHVDVVGTLAGGPQGGLDPFGGVDGEEDGVDLLEPEAELLDRVPDGGRVHDRHDLVEVLAQQPVEQDGVAVAQTLQVGVLLQRRRGPQEPRVRAVELPLQRGDPLR